MIKHLRLINGDELVAEVTDEDDNKITTRNPMIVDVITDEHGSTNTVLQTYLKFQESGICVIDKRHVIVAVPVPDEVCTYYEYSKKLATNYDERFREKIVYANKQMKEYIDMLETSPTKEDVDEDAQPNNVIDSFKYITRRPQ